MIIVDTREKPRAIVKVLEHFDAHGVQYKHEKLDYGDYMVENGPKISVDRKKNIAELAKNCTYVNKKMGIDEPARFRREMDRAAEDGARLVILVEQNRYQDRGEWIQVRDISDLIRWSSPHTMVRGEKVYRVLYSWRSKWPIDVIFCDKRTTGRMILEILYSEDNDGK